MESIASMRCPHCSAEVPVDDAYCEVCGRRLHPRPEEHLEIVLSPDFAGVTDRGLKRYRNEDRFAVAQAGDSQILVVCDGVSSSHESQLASEAAVKAASEALAQRSQESDPEAVMRAAIQAAAAAVTELGSGHRGDNPPSTTIVAALARRGELTVGWLGDSRAYWIASGQATQITTDHASPTEAHAIIRWLGADAPEDGGPDIVRLPLTGPRTVLLCSDGLWNYAPHPEEIAALMNVEGDALAIARNLVAFACSKGGADNVTAAILRLEGANEAPGESHAQ